MPNSPREERLPHWPRDWLARARGALYWTIGALIVAGIGITLVASGATPYLGYAGSTSLDRYLIVVICVVGIVIVIDHGGRMWLETATDGTESPRGARFHVVLPADKPKAHT